MPFIESIGIGIFVMLVVFIALICLCLCLKIFTAVIAAIGKLTVAPEDELQNHN